MLPQKTSVFSEYENNSNPSLTSPQLEHWLRHPTQLTPLQPTTEWTLMSNHSEQQEPTVRRQQTFPALQENDSLALNVGGSGAGNKAKSYIKAMSQLQGKAKQLQQDNQTLQNTVRLLREQNFRSARESGTRVEEMEERMGQLERRARRQEELVRENKLLRDKREEQIRRIKGLQRVVKAGEERVRELEERVGAGERRESDLRVQLSEVVGKGRELGGELQKLQGQKLCWQQQRRELQELSQKTNSSILTKYNRILGQVENLTGQNQQLRTQLDSMKEEQSDRISQLQESYQAQVNQIGAQLRLTEQENATSKQKIESLEQQTQYFKLQYTQTKQQLISALTQQATIYAEEREKKLKTDRRQKDRKETVAKECHKRVEREEREDYEEDNKNCEAEKDEILRQEREEAELGRVSIIQHNLATDAQLILSELQFDTHPQEEVMEIQEQVYETRSAGKQQVLLRQNNHTIDTHSQHYYPTQRPPTHSVQPATHTPPPPRKQYQLKKTQALQPQLHHLPIQNQKQRQLSHSKSKSKERKKSKNDKKSKEREKESQNQSFVLKSHQPASNQQEINREDKYHSANPRVGGPYYWEEREVGQFVVGDTRQASQSQQLERAILNELNREAVRLIEEQERLVGLSGENLPSNDRAENIGRLKQVSEQLRVNTQKIIELKQKLNSDS